MICNSWEVALVCVFLQPFVARPAYVCPAFDQTYFKCYIQLSLPHTQTEKGKFFTSSNPQTTVLPWSTSSSGSRHVTCDSTWWGFNCKTDRGVFYDKQLKHRSEHKHSISCDEGFWHIHVTWRRKEILLYELIGYSISNMIFYKK